MATSESTTFPRLVADVGGTNARFGLVFAHAPTVVAHVETIAVASQPSLEDAAAFYLANVTEKQLNPKIAAIAVATPIAGDVVAFTNSPWQFSQTALRDALGISHLRLLNDFEALALSLPRLSAHQLRLVNDIAPTAGIKAVVGPGTGLGVGAVVPTASGWVALPGEGGHVTLAAADEAEAELLAYLRRSFAHVSAERLLSGTGLPTLYAGVCAVAGVAQRERSARDIVAAGLDGSDPQCHDVIEHFCAMLGGVCGNAALTLGAVGGVYIGGGIVPRLGARFFDSKFRARFEAKGRFDSYLKKIATPVITDTFAALNGAALALEQMTEI